MPRAAVLPVAVRRRPPSTVAPKTNLTEIQLRHNHAMAGTDAEAVDSAMVAETLPTLAVKFASSEV